MGNGSAPALLERLIRGVSSGVPRIPSPDRVVAAGPDGRLACVSRWPSGVTIDPAGVRSNITLRTIDRGDVAVLHVVFPTTDEREIVRMVPFQVSQRLPVDIDDVCWTTSLFPLEHSILARIEVMRRDQLFPTVRGIVDSHAYVPLLCGLCHDTMYSAVLTVAGTNRWFTIARGALLIDEDAPAPCQWSDFARTMSLKLRVEVPVPTVRIGGSDPTHTVGDLYGVVCDDPSDPAIACGAACAVLTGAPTFAASRSKRTPVLARLVTAVTACILSLCAIVWADYGQQSHVLDEVRALRVSQRAGVDSVLALQRLLTSYTTHRQTEHIAAAFESLERAARGKAHLDYLRYEEPDSFRMTGWAKSSADAIEFTSNLETDSRWKSVDLDMLRKQNNGSSGIVFFEARAYLMGDDS